MRRWLGLLSALLGMAACLMGCAGSPGASHTLNSPPQATEVMVYDQLRSAFQIGDRADRRKAVLSLTRVFLADIESRQVGDDAASALLTDIAQTSRLLLDKPAIVLRYGSHAVVGFPDGLGLFLYDLQAPADSPPLELSPWTAGLSTVQVTWLPDEAGVLYFTTGIDRATSAHYALASQTENQWQLVWLSDEDPDWWFNVRNATVTVSSDLQTITVVGESGHNSAAFDEAPGSPRRSFGVEWRRREIGYAMSPRPESDADRTAWKWRVALPSPYATLVEFVERVRLNDMVGAGKLVTDPGIVSAAFAFGLNFPENRFKVTSYDPNSITIQSVRGTFVVGIKPPEAGADRPWLIRSLSPIGSAPPTP